MGKGAQGPGLRRAGGLKHLRAELEGVVDCQQGDRRQKVEQDDRIAAYGIKLRHPVEMGRVLRRDQEQKLCRGEVVRVAQHQRRLLGAQV